MHDVNRSSVDRDIYPLPFFEPFRARAKQDTQIQKIVLLSMRECHSVATSHWWEVLRSRLSTKR
jgi:hypothetical protein